MAELRTEEEQIAALKEWWKENGNSILIAIAAAVILAVGWRGYQNSVVDSKTQASAKYQELLAASTENNALGQFKTSEAGAGVTFLAQELKDEFEDTEYAVYAALFLAKEAVSKNELDQALSELEWIKETTEDTRLIDIANARIARILSAQGKHEEALAVLEAKEPEFANRFLELTGDIKLRMGDKTGAVDAYTEAFKAVSDEPQLQPLLAVKLANLGVNSAQL